MRCEQARQLFDAYLDGELSAPLATELGAHRVHCAECRRALALLEVSGQVIASDRDTVGRRDDLADRLLSCMETPPVRWTHRFRRVLYIAGPLAAAAVVALAFLGVFDSRDTRVAGEKSIRIEGVAPEVTRSLPQPPGEQRLPEASNRDENLLEQWIEQTRKNMTTKRESGESLQQVLDQTILQLLDALEQAKDAPPAGDQPPGVEGPVPPTPPEAVPTDSDDVEDP